jgi:uncharacterized protein
VKGVVAFLAGLVFALGLAVGGMTDPRIVTGFLDVTGAWNPRLAMVMAGATGVFGAAYWLGRRVARPAGPAVLAARGARIDGRLLLGSALFGIGWGIAGFCPGPALTALFGGLNAAVAFSAAMLGGLALNKLVERP